MTKKCYILLFACLISLATHALPADSLFLFSTEAIIEDICRMLTETDDGAYDEEALNELQEQLTERSRNPINLYTAGEEDLRQLHFLSETQITNLLVFVHSNKPVSLQELRLLNGFNDWELRNLLPFITLLPPTESEERLRGREVFHYAKHELTTRVDARNIENVLRDTTISDPVFAQLKYKFNYQNRVRFGLALKRPTGANVSGLQYGGYIQLSKIGAMQTLVVGDYKASFGLGLVLSEPFHAGKRAYLTHAGAQSDYITHYSSPYSNALRGAATTIRMPLIKNQFPSYTELTALYSYNRENDSLKRHTAGLNLTFHYRKLKVGATFVHKFYSDSVRYYFRNAAYNQHYFRGKNQAVIGLNARYNFGRWNLFGEVATAQNQKWGIASVVGLNATPRDDISLTILHRYYSLYWDNPLGYAFSETTRLNDEHGIYVGLQIRTLRRWLFDIYGDFFYFAGPKYRIPYYPSWGYDALAEAHYAPNDRLLMNMRARAKGKAKQNQIDLRYQLQYRLRKWQLRTELNANTVADSTHNWTFGASISQDISYTFRVPLVLQARLQAFYIPNYNNRIYSYENDVLYAFSSAFVNGIGGRAYINLRWRCTPWLSLYFRASETISSKITTDKKNSKGIDSKTDLHLLLRFTF